MEITYLGHASFKLKGKTASVVTDPYPPSIGLTMPTVSADIVTVSHTQHDDHDAVDRVSGTKARPEPFVIQAPGEYEVQGVSVFGTTSFHDDKEGQERGKNTLYVIHLDDLVVAHLGDLGHKLTQKQVDEVNGVDVLLIPVGGVYTIDPTQAIKVIDQVEPAIVVPMHYRVPGVTKALKALGTVDDFLKEAGITDAKREKKLVLTKNSLPEDREIVVLEI